MGRGNGRPKDIHHSYDKKCVILRRGSNIEHGRKTMMKKLTSLLLLLVFFSCHNKNGNNSNIILKTDSSKKENIVKSTLGLSVKKDSSPVSGSKEVFAVGSPEITRLPFGLKPDLRNFHYTESYFIAMLSQNKSRKFYQHSDPPRTPKKAVYKLPPIKSVEYITLPLYGLIDTGVCNNGKPFGDYIKLQGYQYRLPDIYNYQCFYEGGYHDSVHDTVYSKNVFQNCAVFITDYEYGYFILYDPKTLKAKVLTIYFDSLYDSEDTYRFFYIDQAYKIHVYDGSINPELGTKPKQLRPTNLSILPNGEIHRTKN